MSYTQYKDHYECRRCDFIFSTGIFTGTMKSASSCIWRLSGMEIPPTPGVLSPSIFCPHECVDGGVGLADFIGWYKVKIKEKE